MADQTAIDVYERGKYSEDHRKHRDGDPDAPKGSPIDHHDATLTESVGRAAPAALLGAARKVGVPGLLLDRINRGDVGTHISALVDDQPRPSARDLALAVSQWAAIANSRLEFG